MKQGDLFGEKATPAKGSDVLVQNKRAAQAEIGSAPEGLPRARPPSPVSPALGVTGGLKGPGASVLGMNGFSAEMANRAAGPARDDRNGAAGNAVGAPASPRTGRLFESVLKTLRSSSEPPPEKSPWILPVDARPQRVVLSVGELTRQIKGTLERGFTRVCVRGEVSGFRGPNVRGHLYFAIKDADACLDVKVWSSTVQRLKFQLKEGMSVVVEGNLDVYEPQGRYSLIVSRIDPEGEGALALAFAQLKERLAAEGLLGENRKRAPRPIPTLPRRIGVITSRTGAALRDFLRVLHHRHPRLSVLVADARMQGEGSVEEVCWALKRLARTDVDVIVVTRGGGSVEQLWTFNEERVARAIFASPIPVVSAIGHEVDVTIADFVADLRMPTPSAAAERLAPVLAELELHLRTCQGRLRKAIERRMLEEEQKLGRLSARLADPRRLLGQRRLHLAAQAERLMMAWRTVVRARTIQQKALAERLQKQHPLARVGRDRARLHRVSERLAGVMREQLKSHQARLAKGRLALAQSSPQSRIQREHRRLGERLARLSRLQLGLLGRRRAEFQRLEAQLAGLSPLAILSRGYSVTFREDGHLIRSVDDIQGGQGIRVRLAPKSAQTLDECEEIDATVTATRKSPPATSGTR